MSTSTTTMLGASTPASSSTSFQRPVAYQDAIGLRALGRNGKYLGLYPASNRSGSTLTTSSGQSHQENVAQNENKNNLSVSGVHPFPREDQTRPATEWRIHRFAVEKRFGSQRILGVLEDPGEIRCGDSVCFIRPVSSTQSATTTSTTTTSILSSSASSAISLLLTTKYEFLVSLGRERVGVEVDTADASRPAYKWLLLNADDVRSHAKLQDTTAVYIRDPFHNFLSVTPTSSSGGGGGGPSSASSSSSSLPVCVPETLRNDFSARWQLVRANAIPMLCQGDANAILGSRSSASARPSTLTSRQHKGGIVGGEFFSNCLPTLNALPDVDADPASFSSCSQARLNNVLRPLKNSTSGRSPSLVENKPSEHEQEIALVEDVLFCLLGVKTSSFIRWDDRVKKYKIVVQEETTSEATTSQEVGRADHDARIDNVGGAGAGVPGGRGTSSSWKVALLHLTRQILPLCDWHAAVSEYIQDHLSLDAGRVQHAFCGALDNLVQEYRVQIGKLETMHRQNAKSTSATLTLHRLWYLVQPSFETMRELASICDSLRGKSGGNLLRCLEAIVQGGRIGNSVTRKKLAEHCLSAACLPFFEILESWLNFGEVSDPYEEFFVRKRAGLSKEMSPKLWHHAFGIVPEAVPGFLLVLKDRILKAGKYTKALRDCSSYRDERDEHSSLTTGSTSTTGTTTSGFFYTRNDSFYIEKIDLAYTSASRNLLNYFLHDGLQLKTRLRIFRALFFIEKGDWLSILLLHARSELEATTENVSLDRLESMLDLSLRSTTLNVLYTYSTTMTSLMPPATTAVSSTTTVSGVALEDHGSKSSSRKKKNYNKGRPSSPEDNAESSRPAAGAAPRVRIKSPRPDESTEEDKSTDGGGGSSNGDDSTDEDEDDAKKEKMFVAQMPKTPFLQYSTLPQMHRHISEEMLSEVTCCLHTFRIEDKARELLATSSGVDLSSTAHSPGLGGPTGYRGASGPPLTSLIIESNRQKNLDANARAGRGGGAAQDGTSRWGIFSSTRGVSSPVDQQEQGSSNAEGGATPTPSDATGRSNKKMNLHGLQNMQVVKLFCLNYKASWPLSLIFSPEAMLRYQCIFRHTLFLRYVERRLSDVWIMEQKMASGKNQIFLGNHGYSLRMRMYHFVHNLVQLCVEAMERNFFQLMQGLEQTGDGEDGKSSSQLESVDDLIALHDHFLYKSLTETLLLFDVSSFEGGSGGASSSGTFLHASVVKILNTCVLFATAVEDFIERFGGVQFRTSTFGGERSLSPTASASKFSAAIQENNRLALQSVLSNEHYRKMIGKFEKIFEQQLIALLAQAREVVRTQHEHFLNQLLIRLDYSDYYLGKQV
ncbi:unnamed protein product [Amoebophrya sp. A25]|nr:unnamed protein product [Amoebophrya sp. A25]|eukprot:GSA25T00001607001.1